MLCHAEYYDTLKYIEHSITVNFVAILIFLLFIYLWSYFLFTAKTTFQFTLKSCFAATNSFRFLLYLFLIPVHIFSFFFFLNFNSTDIHSFMGLLADEM